MKCELCKEKDAAAAIVRKEKGVERELYVCQDCARKEKLQRKQKSQRTRKVTMISGGEPPPFIKAIASAFDDIISDLNKAGIEASATIAEHEALAAEPKLLELDLGKPSREFHFQGKLHLEGLHLISELDAVKRAARALKLKLVGVELDGLKDIGHVFTICYPENAQKLAERFREDVIKQEYNARVRLVTELPRVIGDVIARALAVLKNARLMSVGELFDLLSPIRLGVLEKLIDGIDFKTIERLAAKLDLTPSMASASVDEQDRLDAERADYINARFEEVILSERAEGLGL